MADPAAVDDDPDELLSATVAAQLLGVSATTLARWARDGVLDWYWTAQRCRLYRRTDVEALMHTFGASEDEPLFTAGEVAKLIGVHPKTVTAWAQLGQIPHAQTPGRHYRFRRSTVLELVRRGTPPSGDYWSPSAAAAYHQVTPKTVVSWTKQGLLPDVRTPGGHRRYRAADVRSFVPPSRRCAERTGR